jgi:diaminohydroxyphosphoribosylaminopyrimidine deaminase/5-amino-6-(5-phosphoribosylamino)uracil reductase
MEDPFPLVGGRGFAMLRAHGIEVKTGIGYEAAVRLNQPFLTTTRKGRPFVILKAATSLDGRMAAAPGQRTQLTSRRAATHAHYVRAHTDAVAVGSETILVDDPQLTAREVYRERPLVRVVFDRRLRTPAGARLLSTLSAGPVIILTAGESVRTDRANALIAAGARVIAAPRPGIASALSVLPNFDVQSLVLEGGARVQCAAWDEGVVDYVQVYVAPVWLGDAGVPFLGDCAFSSTSLIERKVEQLGPDVLIEGYVHRPH